MSSPIIEAGGVHETHLVITRTNGRIHAQLESFPTPGKKRDEYASGDVVERYVIPPEYQGLKIDELSILCTRKSFKRWMPPPPDTKAKPPKNQIIGANAS